MGSCEDLEYNSFFTFLQNNYATKYEEAQKNLWLICVPYYKALEGVTINEEFIDSHILKPSPFFKSHYITVSGSNDTSFEIEDSCIRTPSGNVKIILEEIAYNQDYKPFKILVIEKPLCSSSYSKTEIHKNLNPRKQLMLSLNECIDYLHLQPGCSNIMHILDKKIHLFNSSYVVLPHYLQDAAVKLQNILCWASQEFISNFIGILDENTKFQLRSSIENYLLSQVHNKLFPMIKKFCLNEDKNFNQILLNLYEANVTPNQLGVQEPFCCQTPSAVVELASLNSKNSPVEKLHCLVTTLELLNKDIEQFLIETHSPVYSNKDKLHITSDELLPLVVNIIIQARPHYLISNLYYVQNFCWEMASINQFSFGLITFQAAKEFLYNHEFDFLKTKNQKIKKELSLEELMEVTVEMQNNLQPSLEDRAIQSQSPIDHQLESVTKMIEASTKELRECSNNEGLVNYSQWSNLHKLEEEEDNLGEFLSSLRQNSLGPYFGKQT